MFGSNKSLRTKYKTDITKAVKDLENSIKTLKKASQDHQKRFPIYYKKRATYEAAIKKIGLERYQEICDGSGAASTAMEKKILTLLEPMADEIRDLADGDLGIDIAEDIATLKPLEKDKAAKEQALATARDMLASYMAKKAELKSKDDQEEYKEWKKALREVEFAK